MVQKLHQVSTSTTDAFNFLYQPLSGDGTIVARFINWQGGSSSINAGLMIRETLAPGAIEAFAAYSYTAYSFTGAAFNYRASVDASTQSAGSSTQGRPLWLKLVRSGNVFTTYCSLDGITWTQVGTSQTITMAQNAYIGLAATSGSTSSLVTATFDNVSISTPTAAAPSISSVLPDGGYVGSQATISGLGFGATQGSSIVTVNDAPMTVNSWSDTSITFTIPAGAVSGYVAVAVAPTMNSSNGVAFVVGTQPESGWMDGDIGAVGLAGSASYANGAFIVKGAGNKVGGTADATNFLYQPLSGDGAIVARVANWQGGSNITTIGLMIRETLAAGATNAFAAYWYQEYSGSGATFIYRTSTDGNSSSVNGPPFSTPYWLRLVRSGNTFVAYSSPDDITWTEVGSETITMAQNVYIGLAVTSGYSSTLTTATFDSVSVSTPNNPPPVITSLSISEGPAGTPVTISGHGFGATQGTNQVILSDMQLPVNSWSDTSINVTIPSGAVTGPMAVLVGPTLNASNSMYFTIASQITPVINSLSPNSNAVGGSVTLIGSGFGASQGTSVVKFNGTAAGTTSWSANNVTAIVPQNATSGPVTLTLGSDGVTSNGVQFTVSTEHFTISGISPTGGQAGTLVKISGSGFGSNAGSVTFNGVAGSVVSWNDTAIIAAVPTGTSTGAVDVEGVAGPTFTVSTAMTLTDSLSNQTTYTPTIAGGRWYVGSSQGSGCSTCDIRGTISSSYDTLGNILSSTDELNHTTSYTYDSNSNVTQVTQPAVQAGTPVTTYTYNSFGEVLTETDPLNHVTTNTYDAHGNLTSVTTPAPDGNTAASITQFGYNSLGELTTITDPLNHVTTMTYNSAGLIATITDPQNSVTTYGYDSRGNRTSITDALNHTTTFTYDAGNRLTQITYPDTTTMIFGYDYRGRRTSVTDQNNKTTTYAYDDADRLVSVTDAANNVTTYGYDTESNLTGITDANNHTTNFTYDAFGRVIGTVFPSTASEAYTYDADNNLSSKTDRNGHTITYVYDALNRLSEKDYPDTTKVEYTYDLVGKILQANDPSGTYGFSYDNMGRLTGTTANYSFLSGTTFTNAYSYDAASNRADYTAPDGSTNTYSYDTLNRLTTLANSATGSFAFSYDALSRRTQITRPNGINTNYAYDNLSRLLSVLHQSGTSTIDGDVYTLDPVGNRSTKQDDLAGVSTTYGYDPIYELLSATQGGTTTESYTYDPVGNRTASLAIPSYTVNTSNELTADSNASYTYDNNGNTLTKVVGSNTTSYAWDFENRLTSVTLPGTGGTVQFKYDPFGRRIEKISPTTTSIFVYDGDGLAETTNGSGGEDASYVQGHNVDQPLAMDRSGTIDYYEQDGLGSVTSLTASTGAVAQSYTYDSFGNTTNSSGSLINFFRYTGREFDTETNLYYYRNRYYDLSTGRFLSEDPMQFAAGDPNLYRYVFNNPVSNVDPTGFFPTGRDKWWGHNDPNFRWWWHRCYWVNQPYDGTREEVEEGWVIWNGLGRPPKGKCGDNKPCKEPEPAPEPEPEPSPDSGPNWKAVGVGVGVVIVGVGVAVLCPECLVLAPAFAP